MKHLLYLILYQPVYNLFIFILALIPGHNLGVAIIALTILIRIVLIPLRYKALESQMHQKEIQPELKRVQEKYKDDKQAQSAAMMQLYKDKGVNPASGCIPMLIQLPLLIVLFYVFRNGFGPEHYGALYHFIKPPAYINPSFLWLKDITKLDHTYILPLLAVGAQFLYSKSLMALQPPSTGKSDDMAQIMSKQMMYFGPATTLIIALRFPAALSLYWFVGSLIDWIQQLQAMKRFETKQKSKTTVSVRRKEKEAS